MANDYKASDIQVLGEIEHVRLNPNMYISRTSEPGHLIEEAFDNALDEAMAGHAKIVAVNIDTKKHTYSILDDGRGIPISGDTAVTISTKLFSGAKFQDRKSAYQICSGLHGVGLVTLLALSTHYSIEIYRGKKHAKFEFVKQKLKNKKITKFEGDKPYSTKIEFTPDKKIFDDVMIDVNRVRERLYSASVELDDVTFVLNIDNKKEVIKVDKDEHFRKNCLVSSDKEITEIIDIVAKDNKVEQFEAKFCWTNDGPTTSKHLSSVNLLPVTGGGSHIIAFNEMIKDFFVTKGKRAGLKFLPGDVLSGIRVYLNLKLIETKFSGQAKYKLDNKKADMERFIKKIKSELESYFNKNGEFLTELLTRFENYRKSIDASKIKTKTGSKRGSSKFTKLRDCTNSNGELFVVEGDSAAGGFIQARDPRKHAIFPLKGKIPSITSAKDILKHKEVGEFLNAIGTGVIPHFDISGLKYDKIICATDADDDGCHIAVLFLMILATQVPGIIEAGKCYLALTPLHAINDKKEFTPLWDDDELAAAKKANKRITRFKGLGELNPNQLKVACLDEDTRHLIQIQKSEDMDYLLKLLSDVETKRKLLNDG